MKPQRVKDFYFAAVSPLTYANHLLWRLRTGARPDGLARGDNGQVWVQLGSGTRQHPAFINVEGNVFRPKDMWLDLRHGLPFPDESVDVIYACHVFEHFYLDELRRILGDCRRVLRAGGGVRLLVPSLEMAVERYVKEDVEWFDPPQRDVRSLGGRLVDFLFCDGQHKLGFDRSFAREVLEGAGFTAIRVAEPRESKLLPAAVLDKLEAPAGYIERSLVVEARKPK